MRYQRAMDAMAKAVSEGGIPCAAAAIWDGEAGLEQSAFGALGPDSHENADTFTRFDLASLTKVVVTAPLLMRLVEWGRISLSDPVSRYFPDFARHGKGEITLLDLAVHISGLPASCDFTKSCKSAREAAEAICAMPPAEARRRRVVYSDLGYIVLGAVVEEVFGKPIDALARREIFEPLNMAHTSYQPEPNNIAWTEYDPSTGKCLCGEVHDENARAFGGVSGHAGLFGTAEDICRYGMALLTNGAKAGKSFLSPSSVELLKNSFTTGLTGADGADVPGRAVGFQLNVPKSIRMPPEKNSAGARMSESAFGHTGFTGTSIWIEPEKRRVSVLMTNRVCPSRENNSIFRLRRDFHDAVAMI